MDVLCDWKQRQRLDSCLWVLLPGYLLNYIYLFVVCVHECVWCMLGVRGQLARVGSLLLRRFSGLVARHLFVMNHIAFTIFLK